MTEIRESGWQGPIKESFGQKVVNGVNNSILAWWEKAGPKPVEDRFVQAHQRVLDSIPDDDSRKEAFRLMADNWKKTGELIGAMATGFDFSLAAVSVWLGMRPPFQIFWDSRYVAGDAANLVDTAVYRSTGKYLNAQHKLSNWIDDTFYHNDIPRVQGQSNAAHYAIEAKNDRRRTIAGRFLSIIPLGGAVASYAGMGPAHIAGALAARAAEGVTKHQFKAKRKK